MTLRRTLFVVGCLVFALPGCARKPLTPATPWADLADDSLGFFTTGIDPGGLKVCYVFDWGDGRTTTTDYVMSGDTVWCTHKFPATGVRYIKAKARSEKGHESGWSPALRFHPSQPPELAEIVAGASRWAVDRWYRSSVRVTDPEGDSVAVKFVWGDLPAAGWSAFVPSGSVITDSCKWPAVGAHAVSVVLKDMGCMISQPIELRTVSISPVAVVWTNSEVQPEASPALGMADGKVVVCAVDGSGVYGINADGTTRWRWQRDPMSAHNSPSTSADGSRLYVADDNRGVICFDVSSGSVIWQLDEQYGDCTPVVGPNGVIFSTSIHTLTRIRDLGDTTAVEWTVSGLRWNTNIALGEDGVIYGVSYGSWEPSAAMVFALDSGGVLLWKDTTHVTDNYGGLMACPALDSRGLLIVPSGRDSLAWFSQGILLLRGEATNLYGGGITVGYDDRVYVQSPDDRFIYCFDSDGRRVWASEPPHGAGDCNNLCALADSSVFFLSDQEYVGCLDWNGQLLWDFEIGDSIDDGRQSGHRRKEGDDAPTPIVGPDGNIYLGYYDGVCCLATSGARLANTAWPTYNHDNARSGWAGRH